MGNDRVAQVRPALGLVPGVRGALAAGGFARFSPGVGGDREIRRAAGACPGHSRGCGSSVERVWPIWARMEPRSAIWRLARRGSDRAARRLGSASFTRTRHPPSPSGTSAPPRGPDHPTPRGRSRECAKSRAPGARSRSVSPRRPKTPSWREVGHTKWARPHCQWHDGATAVKQRHEPHTEAGEVRALLDGRRHGMPHRERGAQHPTPRAAPTPQLTTHASPPPTPGHHHSSPHQPAQRVVNRHTCVSTRPAPSWTVTLARYRALGASGRTGIRIPPAR